AALEHEVVLPAQLMFIGQGFAEEIVVSPVTVGEDGGGESLQRRARSSIGGIASGQGGLDKGAAPDEAALGLKVGMDARQPEIDSEPPPVRIDRALPDWPAGADTRCAGEALAGLELEGVNPAKHEPSIHHGQPVVIAALDPVGVYQPYGRLTADVALQAKDV